jgi:hypothetical protein
MSVGQRVSFNGASGNCDIEGKAAMVAASECGQGASFNYEAGRNLPVLMCVLFINNSILQEEVHR